MTVVLLHPFPLDARLWHEVSALLGRDDLVIPNLLGCGGRDVSSEPPSMAALARDVWAQIDGHPSRVGERHRDDALRPAGAVFGDAFGGV